VLPRPVYINSIRYWNLHDIEQADTAREGAAS
jgi:hypothetical protein